MKNLAIGVLMLLFVPALAADDSPVLKPVLGFTRTMSYADLDAFMALFEEDATVFMPFDSVPKRLEGKAAIREVFGEFFDRVRKSGEKPPYMQLTPLDMETRTLRDTAIVTFHLGNASGAVSRRTFVLVKRGDDWRIAHLHASNMRPEQKKE